MPASVAFVPDWDPSKIKTKPRTEAPFVTDDAIDSFVSTYQTHFAQLSHHVPMPREQTKPAMAYPWKEAAMGGGNLPRSTSQDSFMMPGRFRQLPSFKPHRQWETVKDAQPLTTTAGAHFIAHPHAQRKPIIPQSRPLDNSKFDTRPTTLDAYKSFPIAPQRVLPIYPNQNGPPIGGGDGKTPYETTSRNSFVPHSVQPYVAAKKPLPSMEGLA